MARRARLVSLLLLIAVLAVAGTMFLRGRPAAPKSVVVERQVSGVRGVAPAPEFLLRHARELALSPAQQQRIQRIATAYRRDIAPTQQELAKADTHLRTYLAQAPKGKRTTPEELSRQAGDVTRLSAVVATARRSYWEQAREILTPAQQRTADALARTASLSDLA